MYTEYLYHGSHTELSVGSYLTPHVSFDYKPYVYATLDYIYALVRCANFNVSDIAIKEEYIDSSHKLTLVELRPNAFIEVFDTDGYIYIVDAQHFREKDGEFVSDVPIEIVDRIYVKNVWDKMNKAVYVDRYNFVTYEESDDYFRQTGCDKEAYLERRRQRIEELNKTNLQSIKGVNNGQSN